MKTEHNDQEFSKAPAEPNPSVSVSPCLLVSLSPLRAWCSLVWLSLQRQARARQMVWLALALLLLTVTAVALNAARGRWNMDHWRSPRGVGPSYRQILENWTLGTYQAVPALGASDSTQAAYGLLAAYDAALRSSGILVFANFLVYPIFVSFLLPVWSLSFATEALGSERESRSLVWLLSRPLPRPAIYLAKYVAVLPWALALNLGGFALICVAAGEPGRMALRLFWLPVVGATLAFCSVFHLMGALFRRAAVVALVYSFFLETILGNLPGYLKRVSVGFYTRCLMFSSAEQYGVLPPEKPDVYWPVEPLTAWLVLIGGTVVCLGIGMVVFARKEYRDES